MSNRNGIIRCRVCEHADGRVEEKICMADPSNDAPELGRALFVIVRRCLHSP